MCCLHECVLNIFKARVLGWGVETQTDRDRETKKEREGRGDGKMEGKREREHNHKGHRRGATLVEAGAGLGTQRAPRPTSLLPVMYLGLHRVHHELLSNI